MKKLLPLFLSVCFLLGLTACGDDKPIYTPQAETNQSNNLENDLDHADDHQNDDYTPETTTTTAPAAMTIDPFAGIDFTVTGISPYCQIAVNNANCSEDAQRYVTYSLDKERYANGDTAIVTAALTDDAGDYILSSTQFSCAVTDQPEYITSLEGLDLTFFNQELDSYIKAHTAAAIGQRELFGVYTAGGANVTYKSVDKVKKSAVYLTSVKKIRENTDIKHYNSLNLIYALSATGTNPYNSNYSETRSIYVNITAYNVVKYADGTLKWGLNDPDSYAFAYKASTESVDYMVTTCITTQSADYNITKIE